MHRPARTVLLSTLALAAALSGIRAEAAVYCVDNISELRNALADADGNGADDTIRLAQVTFNIEPFTLETFVQGGEDLTIEGGWMSVFGPCNVLVDDASLSVLDGLTQRQVLRIEGTSGNGSINVRNLTIRNGRRPGAGISGAGLTIEAQAAHNGNVTVERVLFRGNSSTSLGAALYVDARATVTVRNSVFDGNDGNTAVAMRIATPQSAFVNNNTVAFNLASEAGTSTAAAGFNGPSRFLSNNVFWFNTVGSQKDLAAGAETTLISNDIQVFSGVPSGLSVGNFSLPPMFVSAASLRPVETSPLINAGTSAALGGVGVLDAVGNPRVVGAIDIGAYESDRMYADGFE